MSPVPAEHSEVMMMMVMRITGVFLDSSFFSFPCVFLLVLDLLLLDWLAGWVCRWDGYLDAQWLGWVGEKDG